MRNSAYEDRSRRLPTLGDVLQHPVVSNVVRLFLIVILALGGYIWKADMAHLNRALEDIRAGVDENIRRQWVEIRGVRRDISEVQKDVYPILYRTNELLYELARERTARPEADGAAPRPR